MTSTDFLHTIGYVEIVITGLAKKQLSKCPQHIRRKFDYWCDLIESVGLKESRKYKGFHDELLKGKRKGQRSVRLSRSYRAIYVEIDEQSFEVIQVIEVNKHAY